MKTEQVLHEALKLKPQERLTLVEGVVQSLDKPDATLNKVWAKEAERRLKAYREGRLKGVSMEKVFEKI